MVIHNERRKGTWGTPLMLFLLTCATGYVGYSVDRELHHIDGKFDALDNDIKGIRLDHVNYQKRLDCLSDNQHWCCKDSVIC